MSIEITGPKAYEYQYLASAYIALNLYANEANITDIYIEKIGGEDAEITYQDKSGVLQTIEIQVKSDPGKFDLSFLSDILCHFGNQQATDNLLARLLNKPNRRAFIITQGRCDDHAANFVVNNGTFNRGPITLPQETKLNFLAGISNYEKAGTTNLKKQRHQFCLQQADHIEQENSLDVIASTIFVYEKLMQDELREKCQQILFKSLNIPLLQTGTVLDDLVKSIIAGRNGRHNIGAEFIRLIDASQANRPVIKTGYIRRPEEGALIDQLRNTNHLLLKGRSLCGKSSTAKAVARHLTERGYLYLLTSNYEDAERFLLSADVVDKICLLDDPMGFIYQETKSDETLHKIRHLLTNLPPGRKIIITANNDVITRLGAENDNKWVDLTVTDLNIAEEIWGQLQVIHNLPAPIFQRVADFIANSPLDKILQPGQLNYIVNNWHELENDPSIDLWQFAAIDADRVINSIKQKGQACVKVMRKIGLVCTTIIPVHESHLEYLFSEADVYPAIRKSKFGLPGRSLLQIEAENTDHYPSYPPLQKLAAEWQQALDFLTGSGFLAYERNSYYFPHPVYFQAAQQLLTGLQKGEADEVETDIKRALSLLEFENVLQASRQLSYVFKNNPLYVKEKMIGIASVMERSIFPAIIDNSLIFLASILSDLNEEQLDQVQSRLTSFEMDGRSFRWHDGIPFIPDVTSLERRLDLEYGLISEATFNLYCVQMLDQSSPNLTAEEAWNFSQYIKHKSKTTPLIVEPLIINKLLDYNEAFIRTIAAFHVFHQFSNPPKELIQKAIFDPHPSVVLSAIKGFVRGWYKYEGEIKDNLLQLVLTTFERPDIVIAATNFITQFGIGYSSNSFDWRDQIPKENQPDMWLLWSKFIIKFFERIPGNIHFNTHRFIATMQDSEEILPKTNQAAIAKSWLTWMLASNKYSRYGDSLFYITNYYFNFSDSLTISERQSFVELLLDKRYLFFTSENLRLFLHKWDQLHAEEKEYVFNLLKEKEDLVYKAVALTAAKVPAEINQMILGTLSWEHKTTDDIIKLIPRPLMETCISVRFVTHRFSGLNYTSGQLWFNILGYFLKDPQDILCKVAIKILLDNYHYGSDKSYTAQWGDIKYILLQLFADKDLLDYIYYLLLEDISVSANSNSQLLWELLKANTDPEYHEFMKKGFIENIKDIESSDNMTIVSALWGDEFYQKAFPTDAIILLMFQGYYQFDEPMPDLTQAMAKSFSTIMNTSQPQLRITFDRLLSFVEKHDPTNLTLLDMATTGRENYYRQDNEAKRENLKILVEGPLESIYIDAVNL